jgi:hypothetical protein
MRSPLVGLLVLAPVLGLAAEPAQRVEFFVGVSLVDPWLDASYTTDFPANLGTGTGGQTLSVQGENGPGGALGVGYFPNPRFGVRLTASRSALDLGGVNIPYAWHTRVTEQQPPDYQPRDFDFSETTPWPDTSGRLKVLAFSLDGVLRWGAGRRVHGSVSGGISALRVSADLAAVGYTTFHLGGHSTFFPVEYQLGLTVEPHTTLGLQLGAEVELALGRKLGLRLAGQVLHAQEFDAAIGELQVLNPDEIFLSTPIADIRASLAPPPLELDASSTRLLIALVLRP